MDFHEFKVGDKVMVNVPSLSVPMYDVPATVTEVRQETGGRFYILEDEVGDYLGVFHPAWLTLAGGDPWNPAMRPEQEVREALKKVTNPTQHDTLLWVLGLLPELPEG